MSDCVYVAWAQAARDLGVTPRKGSRELFDLAKSLFGEPEGLWAGAAPAVLGLLCRMHGLTLAVSCHPWFDRTYYRAAATSPWQHWAVVLWRSRAFWREVAPPRGESWRSGRGKIHLWLGGHHAYYALKPGQGHLIIMSVRLYRRTEVK